MRTQTINHLAVWICVIAFQLLSILWYSPLLFAHPWMAYLGKTFADFQGESGSGLFFSITGAIAFNYFLAWLFRQLQVESAGKGLVIALCIALWAFVFPTLTEDSFSLRPLGLSLINSGNVLLSFALAGLVLGGWRKYRSA